MKILITSNKHIHYNRTGEIVGRNGDRFIVLVPSSKGTIQTSVKETEFKEIKRQERAA